MSKRSVTKGIACLAVGLAGINSVYAEITAVVGPASSLGALPAKIAPPSDVLNDCVTGLGQLGFDERQGVVTPVPFNADDAAVIPAGTLIDSHMIFFNKEGPAGANHQDVVWTFKRPIIAVMSNQGGSLEVASTPALGAPGTNYTVSPSPNIPGCTGAPPFGARGLETTLNLAPYTHTNCPFTNDCYTLAGNTIMVRMSISQPGDWMRVITRGVLRVDAKPGSNPNCVNPASKGVLSVAVLGTASFNVGLIVPSSIMFGGALPLRWSYEDANADGFTDLVLKYETTDVAIGPLNAQGCAVVPLNGALVNGTAISGGDILCIPGLAACNNSTPQPPVL